MFVDPILHPAYNNMSAESQCSSGLLQSTTHLLRGCVQLNTTADVAELRYGQCSLARCGVSNHSDTPYCCQPDQVTPVAISCSGSDVQDLLQMNKVVFSQPSAESCSCQPCSGVHFELAGRVRGVSGDPVPMARVSLKEEGRVTFTNKNGLFAFKLNATVNTVELVVSAGGYHTLSLPVELNPGLQRAHIIHITMNPEWITVLDVPDSSSASVLVTVVTSRTVVAMHKGKLRGEDGGGTVLSLPEPFRQSFLEAGFAVVVGIHSASTASLQTTVSSLLVVTEVPSHDYSLTGSDIGSPLNFTLSTDEDEVLLARELFRLRMYVNSAGKLQNASEVLESVATLTFQLIHTGPTGSLNVFFPSDLVNRSYIQHTLNVSAMLQLSKKKRRQVRQMPLDPASDTSVVVMSALEEMKKLPEYFLVGSRVPACFVGVRAFSSEGVEREDVLVMAMVSNRTVVTMTTSTTPACMLVPCPRNKSLPFLAVISATDKTRLTYIPESFTFVLEMGSPFLFPNRASCQNTSLRTGAHESWYIAFRAPAPTGAEDSFSQALLTPVSILSSSVQNPPYCYMKIVVPNCDVADIRIFVASYSSREISTTRTRTMEGPEFGSSGMYCDNALTFCLPYTCSSNVSVRVEKWLPNAVEPDFCEPASIPLDYYNRDNGVLVLPLATNGGNGTLNNYTIFYSSSSQRIAYAECQSSPFSTLQYNSPTQ